MSKSWALRLSVLASRRRRPGTDDQLPAGVVQALRSEMLEVNYRKPVPYPLEVVFSQYYDYEHIEQVHPDTLGEYVLVEQDGDRLVYEQIWPKRFGRRRRSLVEQTFSPPAEIWFRFLSGLYRGTAVRTRLEPVDAGTLVDETYFLPYLPNLSILRRLSLPSIVRRVDQVWDEDLEVEVCHGGWPGLPPSYVPVDEVEMSAETGSERSATEPAEPLWAEICLDRDLPSDGRGARFVVEDLELALFRDGDEIRCLTNRCPHSGGPLGLGRLTNGSVTCPWHGARFSIADGRCLKGPGEEGVLVFPARIRAGRIEIEMTAGREARPMPADAPTAQ